VAKRIIRFYSDRISLKISKDKIRNFSVSAVKLYDLKITYTQRYCSGNQELVSHVISGSKLHAAHVVRWSENFVWGCLLTDGDSLSGVRRCRHTRDQSVACYVSFRNSCVRDLRHLAGLVQGRYLPDDTVQFVSLTHIVANRGAGEQ